MSGQRRALATLTTVLFLTFLDTTIVSVALADIQTDLSPGVVSLQWIVNGYALTFAALMLPGGSLGDLFGRKRLMLAGVAVFCAGSVVSALAPDTATLIAGRVVMGVGAALSEPGTLSILRHVFPERAARARALGVWAAVSALALALGPVIGGAIVGVAGWREVFWFNLALGALAFAAAALTLPESADRGARHVDVPGLALVALALGAGTYAVIAGENAGYASWWVVTLFAVAGVAAAAFVAVERRSDDPAVDLAALRRPAFAAANVVAFTTYFGVFALFFFVALYLQLVAGASAYATAAAFLPMAAGMIVSSAVAGRWVAGFGPRTPMAVGTLLGGAGLLATDVVLSPTVGAGTLGAVMAIAGIGFGLAIVPVTSTALSVVSAARSGMAAAVTNTSRAVGAVVGVAVLGSVVNAQLTGQLARQLAELGIPAQFQAIVIQGVTHGAVPKSPAGVGGVAGGQNPLVAKVIQAAQQAFGAGLDVALLLSGAMLLASAVLVVLAVHGRPAGPAGATEGSIEASPATQ